jgi:sodium transport system permease protein
VFLVVFKKEILNFFRDKNTIIYSIVLPVALYPVIFWVMNQLITLQRGFLSDMPSRTGFVETPPEDLLFLMMESDYDFEFSGSPVLIPDGELPNLKHEQLDIIIREVACRSEKHLEFFFDSSSDRSNKAKERIEVILDRYRLAGLHAVTGIEKADQTDVRLVEIDLSSAENRSRFVLGMLLPMIIVIITVMGGIYPSIEVITGERERKTIETTLVAPVSPTHLIVGKFGAVIAMSSLAGILNITAMVLTLRYTLFAGFGDDLKFSIPWYALPWIILGIVLTASAFNAVMILIAAFASDFKEAQSYISPIYAIGIQPAIVSAIPGIPFNAVTALIPITNVSLFFRALIQNSVEFVPAAITLSSLLIWCVILLAAARKVLGRDNLVQGLNKQQIKSLFFKRSSTKGGRT